MSIQELEKFIEDNHRYMTMTEILDFTQASQSTIRRIIARRCFPVITIGERTVNYIRKHQHMSFNELLKKLDMNEESLYGYLKKMGITVKMNQRDKPLNGIDAPVNPKAPKVIKTGKSKAAAINSLFDKYSQTITWKDLVGNSGVTWSSY
jgi:predicted DNA-binding transcriptional regulator AlpA